MPSSSSAHRPLLVWAGADQIPWLSSALERAGLTPARAGGPGLTPHQITELGAEPIADLSMALRSVSHADVLLLNRPAEGTLEWLESRAAAAELRKKNVVVTSLDPLPTSALSPLLVEDDDPYRAVYPRRSPIGVAFFDAMTTFGAAQTVLYAARGVASQGGLGALLVGALDTLSHLQGEPEAIDAAISTPRAASGVRAAPADDLSLLRGSLTAHLRFESGASAVIALADSCGRSFRGVTVTGDAGLIRFSNEGFEWTDTAGALVDRTDAPGDPVAVLADQIIATATGPAPAEPPSAARTLALAGAAVLSARTGQPESPVTIRRMAGMVV